MNKIKIIKKNQLYKKIFKRPLDTILSLLALICLSPVLIVVALLVRILIGKPVIFKQDRPGLKGEIFTIYKFRTMLNIKDKNGNLLEDNERFTKFGNFLRSTSLDELPELYNILRGDMSFVGPRPLLIEYLALYDESQMKRHDVRPGLSGLAQVNGRNAISWEEKFSLDSSYVDNVNFLGDCKIILLTIKKVFLRDGINSSLTTTMEPFKGNQTNKND